MAGSPKIDLSKTRHRQWQQVFTLLGNPKLSEIEITGPDKVFARVSGRRVPINGIDFGDLDEFMRLAKDDVLANSLHYGDLEHTYALWEAGLRLRCVDDYNRPTGREIRARFHMMLPPTCYYPQITIAKFDTEIAGLDDMVANNSMSRDMATFLKLAVSNTSYVGASKNIVFSGGTGAGKTTMLSAVANFIPKDQRIAVCEDTPELVIPVPNASYLMCQALRPGMESKDQITLDFLIQQVQRMRTDYTIVGECRGSELAYYIDAANSGQSAMTTVHASSATDALNKMSRLVARAPGSGQQSLFSLNMSIAESVDYIVQLGIVDGHKHRTFSITEVASFVSRDSSANFKVNDLWVYNKERDTYDQVGSISDPRIRNSMGQTFRPDASRAWQ